MPAQLAAAACGQPPVAALRTVPVAASTTLAGVLTGPGAEATVLLAGRYAAYLDGPTGVFAVVVTGATAPSASLVLPSGTRPDDVLEAGAQVWVGDGGVAVPAPPYCPVGCPSSAPSPRTLIRPLRWWEPARVRPGAVDAGALRVLEQALRRLGPAVPADVVHARTVGRRAAHALVAGAPDQAAEHLRSVLGLGPGTTPSGDDVAAGVLLAGHALLTSPEGRCDVRRLAARVHGDARDRTGAVSVAMLAEAGHGRGAAAVVRAVDALAGSGHVSAVVDLLRLGHHSGADIACGAVGVVDCLLRRAGAEPALTHGGAR